MAALIEEELDNDGLPEKHQNGQRKRKRKRKQAKKVVPGEGEDDDEGSDFLSSGSGDSDSDGSESDSNGSDGMIPNDEVFSSSSLLFIEFYLKPLFYFLDC